MSGAASLRAELRAAVEAAARALGHELLLAGQDGPHRWSAWVLAAYFGGMVDLGPCPACEDRGGSWDWGHAYYCFNSSTWVPDPGWTLGERRAMGRPCLDCTVDGKPTGRHVVSLSQAVLIAISSTRAWNSRRRARASMRRGLGLDTDAAAVTGDYRESLGLPRVPGPRELDAVRLPSAPPLFHCAGWLAPWLDGDDDRPLLEALYEVGAANA